MLRQVHQVLLLVNGILPQYTRTVRTDSHRDAVIRGMKVALIANRGNNVSHFEVLDCRAQTDDLGGGIRAWDALFRDSRRVLSYQHSDVAVVERYSVDLDDYIVGAEVFFLRQIFLALLKGERVLTRGLLLTGAATVGRVGRWIGHDGRWIGENLLWTIARIGLMN